MNKKFKVVDLNRAACDYEYIMWEKGHPEDTYTSSDIIKAFKAGANWQKRQMINGAVETIIDSKPNDYGEFIPIIHVKLDSSYKDGEKVKVIIIKEE